MEQLKEQTLIAQLRQGNQEAYKELFDLYYPVMCSVAMSYIKDKGVCEHIADDVIFKIWEKRELIKIETSLKGYLMRAARNGALDYIRAQKVNPVAGANSTPIYSSCSMTDSPLFVADSDLFEQLIATDLGRKIESAIAALPQESRQVFCMSRFQSLSYEEIAERSGISVNTVKYHIKSSLQKLRVELKDYLAVWPFFL